MKTVYALALFLGAAAVGATPAGPAAPKSDPEALFARASGECRSRWKYCGKTLLNMGWSRSQVIDRVRNKGDAQWLAENNMDNVLFSCGADNALWFNSSCNKPGECVNAGANRDDYCS